VIIGIVIYKTSLDHGQCTPSAHPCPSLRTACQTSIDYHTTPSWHLCIMGKAVCVGLQWWYLVTSIIRHELGVHMTHTVWKSSKELGCGGGKGSRSRVFLDFIYSPGDFSARILLLPRANVLLDLHTLRIAATDILSDHNLYCIASVHNPRPTETDSILTIEIRSLRPCGINVLVCSAVDARNPNAHNLTLRICQSPPRFCQQLIAACYLQVIQRSGQYIRDQHGSPLALR